MSWKSVTRHLFTKSNVEQYAPDSKGDYYLYEGTTCTYIGSSTVSRRSRLLDHHGGKEGACTKGATRFGSEYSSTPKTTERAQLRAFKQEHGKLPKCNDRI